MFHLLGIPPVDVCPNISKCFIRWDLRKWEPGSCVCVCVGGGGGGGGGWGGMLKPKNYNQKMAISRWGDMIIPKPFTVRRRHWLSRMHVPLVIRMSQVRSPSGPATFSRGYWSWNIFFGQSLPVADTRWVVVSFWRKNVHKYWLKS